MANEYTPPLSVLKRKQEPEWERWKTAPSTENLQAVLNPLSDTVDTAVKSFGGGNQSLKTRAWILAKEALGTYDPNRGASLNTHVYQHLRRLNRIDAERRQAVHVPENVRLDSLAIQNYVNRYRDEQGREPSSSQIADGLQMSSKRVRKALGWAEIPESTVQTEKGDSTSVTGKSREQVWADYVYHDLDDRDKVIFEHTTGYQGAPRLQKGQIAAKLGISNAAVSQRVSRIVERLGTLYDQPQ